MWLLNCALSSLLLPVLGVAALWKAADLRTFTVAYLPESLPMLVCGMVCTIAAMNFITAPSVSLEGGTLWLLQSLPVTPQQVLQAKVELQLLLTLPAVWLCAGCAMAALRIPAGQGLPVLADAGSLCVADGAAGPCFGVVPANLHWVSEAARGQAERGQYAGDVRRVAAGGRSAVFAPDLTGLRCAARWPHRLFVWLCCWGWICCCTAGCAPAAQPGLPALH